MTTYAALALCCALLSYGAVNAVVSLGVAVFWRLAGRQWRTRDRYPGSRILFLMRMLPCAGSILFLSLVSVPAFLRFEPRNTTETVSPLMLAVAAVPALLLARGALRGVLSWIATKRLVTGWVSRSEPGQVPAAPAPTYFVDCDFPVVSLVGVLRPRLFLSRQVASSFTPKELSTVLAHEAAHRTSGDNLKRLLMRSCPDFLSLTSIAESIESTWCGLSDLAADESAAGRDLDARTELAAALVKVARLAAGRPFPYDLRASALHQGGNIDRRVRRLVSGHGAALTARRGGAHRAWLGVGMLVLFSLTLEPRCLEAVHRVTEVVVRLLQ